MARARFAFMPHDADYYRARAIEQRGWARDAARDNVAVIHRQLAQQYERLAEQCDGMAEEFDALAERASHIVKQRAG